MENIQLAFRSIGIAGASSLLVGFQLSASSCSRSIMLAISGRTDGESGDSNSSSQVSINSAHNPSENPTIGLSGRVPLRTFCMTAASGLACSKGLRPVTTYRGKVLLRDRSSSSGEPIRASRIVIPRAYISVLFDGNFLRARLTYPYLSGSRISGAIHRIVPPAL